MTEISVFGIGDNGFENFGLDCKMFCQWYVVMRPHDVQFYTACLKHKIHWVKTTDDTTIRSHIPNRKCQDYVYIEWEYWITI